MLDSDCCLLDVRPDLIVSPKYYRLGELKTPDQFEAQRFPAGLKKDTLNQGRATGQTGEILDSLLLTKN